MHLTRVGAVLFIATLCFPASAQIIDACIKNDGSLRIVGSPADCRSKESPISWNATGPEGPQGPVGEQGPAGNNLWVVDGNGTTVGQLVDWKTFKYGSFPFVTIYLDSAGAIAHVDRRDGKLHLASSHHIISLFFDGGGCEGLAYAFPADAGELIPNGNFTRFYVARPGALVQPTLFSVAENGVCRAGGTTAAHIPAEEVTGLLEVTFPVPLPITVVSGGN